MTAHKTMTTVIHAAFRQDLARFDAALAGFTDGDRSRAHPDLGVVAGRTAAPPGTSGRR